jgi:hypothetical protein
MGMSIGTPLNNPTLQDIDGVRRFPYTVACRRLGVTLLSRLKVLPTKEK